MVTETKNKDMWLFACFYYVLFYVLILSREKALVEFSLFCLQKGLKKGKGLKLLILMYLKKMGK